MATVRMISLSLMRYFLLGRCFLWEVGDQCHPCRVEPLEEVQAIRMSTQGSDPWRRDEKSLFRRELNAQGLA
jgi:hypothetical protein